MRDNVMLVLTASDLLGTRIPDSEITSILEGMSKSDALVFVALLEAFLFYGPTNADTQRSLLELLPWSRVPSHKIGYPEDLLKNGGVLVSPEQIMRVQRWCIEKWSSTDHLSGKTTDVSKKVMLLLIAAGDKMGQLAESDIKKLGPYEAWLQEMIRNTSLNRRGEPLEQLVRAWHIFTDSRLQYYVKKAKVDAENLIAVGIVLYGDLLSARGKRATVRLNRFDTASYSSKSILADLAPTPSSMQETLESESTNSFRWIRSNPAITISGHLIPLSLTFLVERLSLGIYYTINDALSKKDATRFRTIFGNVLESYVVRTLQMYHAECKGEIRYKKGGGAKTIDAWISWKSNEFLFEVKAKRLPIATQTSGNLQEYDHDLEEGIIKAARQCVETAQTLYRGLIPGVAKLSGPFWPFIVNVDDFGHADSLTHYVDTRLAQVLRPEFVKFPRRITVGELRQVEGFLLQEEITLADLLFEWVNSPSTALSLIDWVYEKNKTIPLGPELERDWMQVVEASKQVLFPGTRSLE